MSPTCRFPRSTPLEPNQTISTVILFIINIIAGIINDITRLVKSCVFIRSRLAPAKRFSSNLSLENARITGTPVRISLETKFRRSTSVCIFLNLGMVTDINIPTNKIILPTATPIIHPIPVLVPITLTTPPIPIMGA